MAVLIFLPELLKSIIKLLVSVFYLENSETGMTHMAQFCNILTLNKMLKYS